MQYPNLFKSRYSILQGRDWIKKVEPDDRAVFVSIGLECAQHGHLGGQAVYDKYGTNYMRQIGRNGANATNAKKRAERESAGWL